MESAKRGLFDLTGKVALITGASRGIGEASAHGLAAFGAKVVVSSRKREAVEAVAQKIREAGHEALAVAAHVGDVAALRGLVESATSAYGGIDILVNNAATNPVFGPMLETETAVFDKVMAVNVKGPLELAKAVQPSMAARGGGSIINISSVNGIRPQANLGPYSVSKSALLSLTQVLAQEWAPVGIRVNAICPGLIRTKFSAAIWENVGSLQRFLDRVPLGRMGQPEDLIGLIVFLASPASSYCTGSTLTIDGGYLCS